MTFYPVALAVSDRTDHVFVAGPDPCTGGGAIAMLDARTGRLLRMLATSSPPFQVLVDDTANRALVAEGRAGPASVVLLDTGSGNVVTTVRVTERNGAGAGPITLDRRTRRAFLSGLVSPHAAGVLTLEVGTGSILHSAPGGGFLVPDERAGQIVDVTDDEITWLDGHTGHILRSTSFDGCGPPGLLDGVLGDSRTRRLFLGTIVVGGKGSPFVGGHFCMLDSRTGSFLRKVNERATVDIVGVDEPAGIVLVARRDDISGPGHTDALDAKNGNRARSLGHLGYPGLADGRAAPVIDPATGRIYALYGPAFRPSTLEAIDPGTWTTRVVGRDIHAAAMALSARTQRLFIAGGDLRVISMLCVTRSC